MCLAKLFLQCQLQEKQFVNGQTESISDEECIREVGKNGSTFVGSKIGSVVGNWLIPIPVFDEIVGCMLGGTLFNYVYNWDNESDRQICRSKT